MLEGIVNYSTQKRYLIIFLTFIGVSFGILSLKHLPIDAVPDITNNQVQINTLVPGFSPFEIEKQVTFPIETALAGIPGLISTRSLSRNDFSQVTAIFEDSVDIYFARQQVSEKIAEAKESLPREAEPKMGAISTGLGEIYMWTLQYAHDASKRFEDGKPGFQSNGTYLTPDGQVLKTEVEKLGYLRTVQDWIIKPKLKTVSGIAGIDSIGGYVKQYHVQPDPNKLIALGVTFEDIINVVGKNNISLGAGYIEKNGESLTVRVDGRIKTIQQLEDIVITSKHGTPVYIRDIATVAIGKELRTGSGSENGAEAVVGTALMLIGANSRDVAAAVEQKFSEITKTLPAGIIAQTVLNRTKLVEATIATVSKNLTEGALLVIVILFLMLKNFRAALITASVIPITMLMTCIGMLTTKTSANLMSLGALDFGLLVDGTVIIIENYLRRIAERAQQLNRPLNLIERLKEIVDSTTEMSRPTLFGQSILILVYLPLFTFTGVEGKMFKPMAITVIIALISAFILSITFIPAMAALLIKGGHKEEHDSFFKTVEAFYQNWLVYGLRHPKQILAGAVGVFLISVLTFFQLGQEFIPTLDEKDIALHAMRIPSTSLTQSQSMQFEVEKTVATFKEVACVFSKTGTAEMATDPMPPNASDTFIIFKPRTEWPVSTLPKQVLIQKIEDAVQNVIGHNYEFTQPIQMRFNELIAGVRSDVAIKVSGDDFDTLNTYANQTAELLKAIPGAADVKVEQTTGLPMLEFKLNRNKIARLGLNVSDVLNVISIAIGGKEAGVIFEGDRRFDIMVKLPEPYRQNLEIIENLPIFFSKPLIKADLITNKSEEKIASIPLKEVAELVVTDGPNQISRENGKRRIVVQANIRGTDMASFVINAQAKIDQAVKLPAGYWIEWGGQFKNLIEAKERLMWVVPLCFLMIFMLLYAALNSVRSALFIFTAIPLAFTGGILSLWICGIPFSISAAVGFIALSGIAVLNGLVMVTTINQYLRNKAMDKAIIEGALTRLRPVLMTALVASLGFIPMAISTGTGAEVQKPLATVVIGGLITSTLLTLMVIPTLYKIFNTEKVV
ncbi:efflux RND transporter permease subunit [Candidatus Odyssella thessalonicensis]|uniref:efflux RND transporter permease subunit n=1 Tax=Candidatus Odyssella thessalonicensis TaxID=84647 RepID=UPI000225AF17|nr:CusA/CzcA family heavy metal efflux RND transporter [Candidatus Odyssella thessalonicensis]